MQLTSDHREELLHVSTQRANAISFSRFVARLDSVLEKSSTQDKLRTIYSEGFAAAIHAAGESTYPVTRLVIPRVDRKRQSYGFQAKKLADIFADRILCLAKGSVDSRALKNWSNTTSLPIGLKNAAGDFPRILELILQKRKLSIQRESNYTIGDINGLLDQLADASNSREEKYGILKKMYLRMTSREMMWTIKIILKEMRIGLNHSSVLRFLHEDGISLYDSCSDLKLVCGAVQKYSGKRIVAFVRLHQPFGPMLAEPAKGGYGQVSRRFSDFAIEIKYDGERMLIHKSRDGKFSFFTRRRNDYTSTYGDLMRRYLLDAVKADEYILDGEMLDWDNEAGTFLQFGYGRQVAKEQKSSKRNYYTLSDDERYMDAERSSSSSSSSSSFPPPLRLHHHHHHHHQLAALEMFRCL